ncbi:unnamed protein product [Caenorhabditis bovis]|uniref:Uncharacterized protein n=1 Tax=Caenorhabditis bovis TaxID=2654633 RepID=A0A8S1EPK6_9PELO|nr:unnamed protein product [Caenorhabditis bovis]
MVIFLLFMCVLNVAANQKPSTSEFGSEHLICKHLFDEDTFMQFSLGSINEPNITHLTSTRSNSKPLKTVQLENLNLRSVQFDGRPTPPPTRPKPDPVKDCRLYSHSKDPRKKGWILDGRPTPPPTRPKPDPVKDCRLYSHSKDPRKKGWILDGRPTPPPTRPKPDPVKDCRLYSKNPKMGRNSRKNKSNPTHKSVQYTNKLKIESLVQQFESSVIFQPKTNTSDVIDVQAQMLANLEITENGSRAIASQDVPTNIPRRRRQRRRRRRKQKPWEPKMSMIDEERLTQSLGNRCEEKEIISDEKMDDGCKTGP